MFMQVTFCGCCVRVKSGTNQKKVVSLRHKSWSMETLIIGLLIPLLGTMLGSAFVFMMKDGLSPRVQKALLGFASGVMVAASVWSLLIPSMDMVADSGKWAVFPAAVGFLLGMGFLLMIDCLTPHLHLGTDRPEGLPAHLSRTAMLALAVTIHNLPEGMAVGVVLCHNHPSGRTQPSRDDDNLTKKAAEACKAVNIRFVDHIIFAGDNYYSYQENGKL